MSGVLILGELLRGYGPLTDKMPVTSIAEDDLPQGADRGIVVESVGQVDRTPLTDSEKRRVTERVRVKVFETTARARRATWNLVRAAGASKRGDFAGVTEVSVLLDGAGPDLRTTNPVMFLKPQDFAVSFNELI